jgi:sec-independent protein translocase protein TatA
MGNIGWSGIIIVAVLVVLLFGRGKISSIMGDVAKGIKSFKKGMSDDTSSSENSTNISSEDTTSEDQNSEKK